MTDLPHVGEGEPNRLPLFLAALLQDDPLYGLDFIQRLCSAAEALVPGLVDQARANGATWEQIAGVLDVTRQAAWQRFGSRGAIDEGRPVPARIAAPEDPQGSPGARVGPE